MIPSDVVQSSGDVMRRLREMERRIQELEGARRLEAASIGKGGITIKGGAIRVLDDDGNLQVQAGLLPDDTYGLAAVNPTGELVSLSTLAFGTTAVTSNVTVTANTESGEFWQEFSPAMTVQVRIGSTRKAVVLLGAEISHTLSSSNIRWGGMAVQIKDLTTNAITSDAGNTAMVGTMLGGSTNINIMQVGNSFLVEGPSNFPTPGGMYELRIFHSANLGSMSFWARTMVVIPY